MRSNAPPERVAVVGLGKLGFPFAVTAASRGFRVLGCDVDRARVARLARGDFPAEPEIPKLAARHRDRLEVSSDTRRVREAPLIFVIVPTPSRRDGSLSLKQAERALRSLGTALRGSRRRHVVALVSTVLPGDMATLRGALEESSSKRCGEGLGLVYNPAFIALGSVVHDLLHPDMILVGESDPRSGAAVEAFHLTLCKSVPTIHRTGFANAELAKIGLNAFVTMKISFANAVARLCESVPGADVDVVCSAIGSDRRIGHRYLKGATAYGGPCFPRDNRALARVARVRGLSMRLAEATDRINGEQGRLLARRVRELLAGRRRVALLGVAYKPETDVVDDSPALDLAEALLASGCRLTLWDPAALGAARRILGARVSYRRSLRAAVRGADVTVIVTPWNEIKRLRATDFGVRGSSRKVIVDCWRVLDARTFAARVKYVPLGVGTVGER